MSESNRKIEKLFKLAACPEGRATQVRVCEETTPPTISSGQLRKLEFLSCVARKAGATVGRRWDEAGKTHLLFVTSGGAVIDVEFRRDSAQCRFTVCQPASAVKLPYGAPRRDAFACAKRLLNGVYGTLRITPDGEILAQQNLLLKLTPACGVQLRELFRAAERLREGIAEQDHAHLLAA